ncbi:MAG: methylenetetrahydrofolate reductase [Pseudomonadota bacterium]
MGSLGTTASAEVTASDLKGLNAAAPFLAPGMAVYIAALPSTTPQELIDVAKAAFDHGLKPVPHLVARNFASHRQLEETVRQLVDHADVKRALVLGGDRSHSNGPFECALDLLNTGIINSDTIPNVAFGSYPEGHPRIPTAVLDRATLDKVDCAERLGLNTRLITQICFDAQAILRHVSQLRQAGITAPVRFGVVGPTKLATLMKYAAICGVGPSLKTLIKRPKLGGKLLSGYTPGELISEVLDTARCQPHLGLIGPHFFTFGALKNTARWVAAFDTPEAYKMAAGA